MVPRALRIALTFLNIAGGTALDEAEARGVAGMRARRRAELRVKDSKKKMKKMRREDGHDEDDEDEDEDEDGKRGASSTLEPVEEQLAAVARLHKAGFLTDAEFEDVKEQVLALTLHLPDNSKGEVDEDDEDREDDEAGNHNPGYRKRRRRRQQRGHSSSKHHSSLDFDPSLQVPAARFLLATVMLDAVAWGVGKIALVEVLRLAHALGFSVVFATLALAAAEAIIEFGASAAVPLLYRKTIDTKRRENDDDDHEEGALSARGLTLFAVGAYHVSAAFALLAYPAIGLLLAALVPSLATTGDDDDEIHDKDDNNHYLGSGGNYSSGGDQGDGSDGSAASLDGNGYALPLLLLFAAVQAVQYPLLNQLGDQAVEMATPHWLSTFEGLVLAW